MERIRAAAAGFLILGSAATGSPTAAANPGVTGSYTFTAEDGEAATWSIAQCPGNPPGCLRVAEFGNSKRAPWAGEAHYSVGSWFMFVQQPDAILCEDGTSAPGRSTYSWDNSTLSGNASVFSGGACGTEPKTLAIPFRLAKYGSVPLPSPDTAPLPETAPPTATELLPAESPAGN